ncbi:MAG: serine hydrolase domain-containing protein [Chitinophagaceae bacterium]
MKKYYLIILLTLLINTAYTQEKKKDYTEAFKLIEIWLEAQKDFEHIPALTAIVIEDQKVLWSGAVGMANVESNIKADASTLFSICSISKLFTSVAIMKLYDEGKLRLDDKVSDLLPAYKLEQKYPESGPITIRSLLTHSSGLPRETAHPYWTGPDFPFPTKEQIDSKLSEQKTLYPASTYFQYSNLGLTLLGEIVEAITKIPYDEYVQKNILTPLRLSDTRTIMPKELYGKKLANGYSAETRIGKREKVNFFTANGIAPAAGFTSNVYDLGSFASWQFRLRDSTIKEILKPSTLKYMQQVHFTDPNWKTTWGLGFVVFKGDNGNTWVGHGGSCPGYRTTLELDLKNKRAYSVMINANGTDPEKYTEGMSAILNKVKTSEKDNPLKPKKDLKEFTGYYSQLPWWGEKYFSTWGDKLVGLSLPSEKPGEAMTFYKYVEGDTFRRIRDDDELGETLVFERDKSGKIIQYQSHGNYSKRIIR